MYHENGLLLKHNLLENSEVSRKIMQRVTSGFVLFYRERLFL